MTEMIERVARAIGLPLSPEARRLAAIRVIRAMREPTDAMAEAGFQETGDPCWPENVKDAWRAMIDAALKS